MEATRRTAPQLQAAPGAPCSGWHAFANNLPGQPEAAWTGNLGKTDTVTVKLA
jgi:hypothetical protein